VKIFRPSFYLFRLIKRQTDASILWEEVRSMRKIISLFVAAVFVPGASVVSMAGSHGIDRREYREQQRINQGIRSGELTRREARRLEAGLARVKIDERFARSDGSLSPRERARLNRELNHESRNIYRQKHDRQDRNP
jgi:hypothetical protein